MRQALCSFLLVLGLTFFSREVEAKCKEAGDCGNFCPRSKSFAMHYPGIEPVGCYDGLCKCFTEQGGGADPCKMKDKSTCKMAQGPCMMNSKCAMDCSAKDSSYIKNSAGYKCTGNDNCFCKFGFKKGKMIKKCKMDKDCQLKGICPKGQEKDAETGSCSTITGSCDCPEGQLKMETCKKESYCKGLCQTGGLEDGMVCTSEKDMVNLCYCMQ